MASNLARARADVALAATRVDRAFTGLRAETRGVRHATRSISPATIVGVALVGGFLFVVLPRRWRSGALASLGQFALRRALDAFTASRDR
jgi:hypothetical protein